MLAVLVLMQQFQLQFIDRFVDVQVVLRRSHPVNLNGILGSEVAFWFGLGHGYDHTPLPAPFRRY